MKTTDDDLWIGFLKDALWLIGWVIGTIGYATLATVISLLVAVIFRCALGVWILMCAAIVWFALIAAGHWITTKHGLKGPKYILAAAMLWSWLIAFIFVYGYRTCPCDMPNCLL